MSKVETNETKMSDEEKKERLAQIKFQNSQKPHIILLNDMKEKFKVLSDELGYDYSESRIPYTYHHDFIRGNIREGLSRAEVAHSLSQDNGLSEEEKVECAFKGALFYVIERVVEDEYDKYPSTIETIKKHFPMFNETEKKMLIERSKNQYEINLKKIGERF